MCGREHSGSFVFFYVDASDSSSYQQPSSAQASDAISINTSFWDYFDRIAKMQLNWDGEYVRKPSSTSIFEDWVDKFLYYHFMIW